MSAILAQSLKTAKNSALTSTQAVLQNKLQLAETNIASLSTGQKDAAEARAVIIQKCALEYKTAFTSYLQVLFEAMSQNEAAAIQAYLLGPVTVNVGMAKLICP